MKRISFFHPTEVLPPIVFLIGFAFMTYHLPGNAIIMIVSGPLAFVISLLQNIFRKDKSTLIPKLMLGITNATWLFYISIKLLFWTNSGIVWGIAIALSLATFILSINKKQIVVFQKLLLIAHISGGTFLFLYPNSKLYYNTRLSKEATQYPDEYHYSIWNKYSWFLYKEESYDEAMDANVLAKISAKSSIKMGTADSSAIEKIEENLQKIESRSWDHYQEF